VKARDRRPGSTGNYERGMTALLKVPKAAIVPLKKRVKTTSSEGKPTKADKD
jgi:hypothetical protein